MEKYVKKGIMGHYLSLLTTSCSQNHGKQIFAGRKNPWLKLIAPWILRDKSIHPCLQMSKKTSNFAGD